MNRTPSPIIAGIDFSASSPAVLRHAVHAAALTGSTVHAVHVLDAGSLGLRALRAGEQDERDLCLQAEAKLEGLIESYAEGAEVRAEVRIGRTVEEIGEAVTVSGASLLVIAANDLSKDRLGAIASSCVRSAPCDVLVLRDWQEGNFRKVLVATDFSPTATKALERGISQAFANGASLELVHVMYPPSRDAWGEVLDHAMNSRLSYTEECKLKVAESMEKQISKYADDLAELEFKTTILVSTSTSAEITSHAKTTGADLLVLGTHGLSKLAGWFIGTNAERMLHDSSVSVLAVRD